MEKKKELNLENLHYNNSRINWGKSIGKDIPFLYNDISGLIKIVSYNKKSRKVEIEYKNQIYEMLTSTLLNCKLGNLFNIISHDYRYDIGEVIGDVTIIDRKTINKERCYKYKCNKCGFECGDHYKAGNFYSEIWIRESNMLNKKCNCCIGKVVVEGINDIPTTAPWMVKYFQGGYDEAKKYTRCSGKKIKPICPDCGVLLKKYIKMDSIYKNKSISCDCCDKKPYPEKFVASVLNQINVDFVTQLSKINFGWCDKYKYDFYIPSQNMIIETHGMQHYKEQSAKTKFRLTLNEQQENDKCKHELALANGINKYVVIDCRYSELKKIKNSVLNSELKEIFNLSKIDWLKCEEFALSNIVREVCEYWNNKQEWETANTIAKNNPWGIKSSVTIVDYLKVGVEHDWCIYDGKKEQIKALKNNGKPFRVIKDEKIVGYYTSVLELERVSNNFYNKSGVYKALKNKCKYKGCYFEYIVKEEVKKLASFYYVEN